MNQFIYKYRKKFYLFDYRQRYINRQLSQSATKSDINTNKCSSKSIIVFQSHIDNEI